MSHIAVQTCCASQQNSGQGLSFNCLPVKDFVLLPVENIMILVEISRAFSISKNRLATEV